MDKSPEIVKIIETLFKHGNTNYSRVASQLKTKSGRPMTRQVLYRMVNNGTISLALFLEILDITGYKLEVLGDCPGVPEAQWPILVLSGVKGERIKKKLNGVVYDSDKMFSVDTVTIDEHRTDEICYNPPTREFIVIHYGDEEAKGKRKFPYIEKYKMELTKGPELSLSKEDCK